MSNLKIKIYARALSESLLSETADKKTVAKNFVKLLQKNGDMKKAPKILELARMVLLKKTGNHKIIVETAREADTQALLKVFAKKGDIIEEKINPALVAGVKITVDDNRELDFSLLKKLESFS